MLIITGGERGGSYPELFRGLQFSFCFGSRPTSFIVVKKIKGWNILLYPDPHISLLKSSAILKDTFIQAPCESSRRSISESFEFSIWSAVEVFGLLIAKLQWKSLIRYVEVSSTEAKCHHISPIRRTLTTTRMSYPVLPDLGKRLVMRCYMSSSFLSLLQLHPLGFEKLRSRLHFLIKREMSLHFQDALRPSPYHVVLHFPRAQLSLLVAIVLIEQPHTPCFPTSQPPSSWLSYSLLFALAPVSWVQRPRRTLPIPRRQPRSLVGLYGKRSWRTLVGFSIARTWPLSCGTCKPLRPVTQSYTFHLTNPTLSIRGQLGLFVDCIDKTGPYNSCEKCAIDGKSKSSMTNTLTTNSLMPSTSF